MLGAFSPLLPGGAQLAATPVAGEAAITVGAVTVAAVGNVPVAAAAGITLGAVTMSAGGETAEAYSIPFQGMLLRTLLRRGSVPFQRLIRRRL